MHVELRRAHVTLMLLWLEYREDFPDGYGYSQFCELYRRWARHVDVVMRQEHKAGEKLFVDFAGDHIAVWDEHTGELAMEAELFVAVLGASSYTYAEAFPSQELMYWVAGHVHALEWLGGCPPDRGLRQPALGGDPPAPLRAGRQRHLLRDGRPLRPGRRAGENL